MVRLHSPDHSRQVVPITQQRQETVPGQIIVVIEILVAQEQPQDPLPDQHLDGMLDPIPVAMGGDAMARPDRIPIRGSTSR